MSDTGDRKQLPNKFEAPVGYCARCKGNHHLIVFTKLTHPLGDYSHWALCPATDEPIMLKVAPDVEYRKSVVLCTSHLAVSAEAEGAQGSFLFPWSYGWLMYCYKEREDGLSDNLWDCCEWVNLNVPRESPDEAIYIFFDQDGSEMEGLQTYEW